MSERKERSDESGRQAERDPDGETDTDGSESTSDDDSTGGDASTGGGESTSDDDSTGGDDWTQALRPETRPERGNQNQDSQAQGTDDGSGDVRDVGEPRTESWTPSPSEDGSEPQTGSELTEANSEGGTTGLFDDLLSGEPIFEDKEVLRPAYTPRDLPHREDQIDSMATVLVSALRGDTPSNILIYGKTGTGKTASAKFVSKELESTSQKYDVPCEVEYINCEVTDTQYRVLAQLANKFIAQNRERIDAELADLEELRERVEREPGALENSRFDSVEAVTAAIEGLRADREEFDDVPMTGWPTDRVYSSFFDAIDYRERVVVIMLDEIDKLVEKSGDDTLYNLSRMNSDL